MRLNKYLAKAGIASRRKSDQLIKNQKIMINGEVVTNFGYRVKNDDIVTFDGKVVSESLDIIYILNKPKGYVCSNTNQFKSKTVFDLIVSDARLFTIGRLDRDTSGVLLITNNGDLSYQLTHPKFHIERKYIVETKIPIDNKYYPSYKIVKNLSGYSIKISDVNYTKPLVLALPFSELWQINNQNSLPYFGIANVYNNLNEKEININEIDSIANALDFDGADDLVSLNLPSVFTNLATSDFTAEMWIFHRNSEFERLFFAQQDSSNYATAATSNSGVIFFYVVVGGTTYSLQTNATVPLNSWTHVAMRLE